MAVLLRNNKGEREGGDRSETVEHNEQKKNSSREEFAF